MALIDSIIVANRELRLATRKSYAASCLISLKRGKAYDEAHREAVQAVIGLVVGSLPWDVPTSSKDLESIVREDSGGKKTS